MQTDKVSTVLSTARVHDPPNSQSSLLGLPFVDLDSTVNIYCSVRDIVQSCGSVSGGKGGSVEMNLVNHHHQP